MQPKIRSLFYDIQQACQAFEDFTKDKNTDGLSAKRAGQGGC
jgi:hypothetical protein